MAGPPVATARQTPLGIMLREGLHSKITLARFPNVSFWEKTVDPPGYEGGEPIDQTTQFNVQFRTRWPRTLIDVSPITIPDAAYDPNVYNMIINMVNVNDTITISFQDGSTIAFYGFLRSFNPNPTREGEQPTCSITIVPTNVDSTFTEQAPTVVSVAGS